MEGISPKFLGAFYLYSGVSSFQFGSSLFVGGVTWASQPRERKAGGPRQVASSGRSDLWRAKSEVGACLLGLGGSMPIPTASLGHQSRPPPAWVGGYAVRRRDLSSMFPYMVMSARSSPISPYMVMLLRPRTVTRQGALRGLRWRYGVADGTS